MKQKTCRICKNKFQPERQMQSVCGYQCSIDYANAHFKQTAMKQKKEANKALKQFNNSDKNILKRLAQKVFNTYIRMRDKDLPCVSCGYIGDGRQWHAGHYKPAGGFGALRYDERNIHKQCSICNNHLSANLIPYRENLIKKIGLETVEELEATTQTKQWLVEELQEIIKTYALCSLLPQTYELET